MTAERFPLVTANPDSILFTVVGTETHIAIDLKSTHSLLAGEHEMDDAIPIPQRLIGLFQIGLGLPAWQSGMLMMPTAAAAMGMKLISTRVLRLFGYRKVLIVNTVMIGLTICLYALVTAQTPLAEIIAIGLALGFFNSLQFSSMNSMAYADIETNESSMASTIASSFQQISMSFGLAFGSLVAAWYLGDLPQSDRLAVITALHRAFMTLGGLTIVSALSFWTLPAFSLPVPGSGRTSSDSGVRP
jgi:MFS family permease